MTGWTSLRHAVRRHPCAADLVFAVVVFLITLAASIAPEHGRDYVANGPSITVGVLICGALAVRRRWPVPVLAVATAGTIVAITFTDARTPYTAVVAVAAYTVAKYLDRRTAWTAGLLVSAVLLVSAISATTDPWSNPRNLGFVAWVAMATAVGDAVRSRRAYVATIEERARHAEQTREEEAGRQVAEERLRIARELHDVVAHHIALINVQAGVATHLLRAQPDAAEEALAHVRLASRTALSELGTLLGVLRQSGDAAAPTEPAPGLDRLDTLVDSFVRAGLRIELTTSGKVRPTTSAVDLAAYRIIQESLTNVQKHSGGSGATVRLEHRADALHIEVSNHRFAKDGPPATPPGGHGLVGMRERAVSVGGTLRAGARPDGRFQVTAVLPRPEEG
ncbi:sensor histidine kinase [Amycolatopsis sp. H20-H5]|uniref:sensor histidine kinase n=1 Tax=Amycolatopsis sp. H20-H5 TaxID=3046309 RepID=UPI002DB59D3B|nr:histidine kinase [Amycolatopsis sp. H20-H5]MEC3979674.1 histidine kinase [Amycolatopsis sp. H20-H5]